MLAGGHLKSHNMLYASWSIGSLFLYEQEIIQGSWNSTTALHMGRKYVVFEKGGFHQTLFNVALEKMSMTGIREPKLSKLKKKNTYISLRCLTHKDWISRAWFVAIFYRKNMLYKINKTHTAKYSQLFTWKNSRETWRTACTFQLRGSYCVITWSRSFKKTIHGVTY